jgi:hypothetical protein
MKDMLILASSIAILGSASGGTVEGGQQTAITIPTKELIGAIRNHDVKWELMFSGLIPRLEGATFLVGKYCEPDVTGQLVSALDDPDRFVAAHVLLTRLLKETSQTGGYYDRLHVVLHGDGSTNIDVAQRGKLKQMWMERLKRRSNGSRDPALK